jgi:hypothetical protein
MAAPRDNRPGGEEEEEEEEEIDDSVRPIADLESERTADKI